LSDNAYCSRTRRYNHLLTTWCPSPILIAAAAGAFLLKIWLAATTFGTNDVRTFELMLDRLQTDGVETLYREGTEFKIDGRVAVTRMNHPPFALTLVSAWGGLRGVTGIPLGFWMRLTCALADLLTLWLVWRLAGWNPLSLLVVAIAPAAIMISGFHGNTDPIMIALVVLATYLMTKGRSPLLAGAALALACSVKVWPLIFVPVFVLNAATGRRRVVFCVSFIVVAAVAALPWIVWNPPLILERVFGYTSFAGWWGIPYLLPVAVYVLRPLVFVSVLAATVFMHRRAFPLFAQCAIVSFVFLFLTPGFGPQYLAWVIPWTVAASWRATALFHVFAGLFVFSMYTAWSRGFPWAFASAMNPIPVWVFWIGLLAWAMLPALTVATYRVYCACGVAARSCSKLTGGL
jgi:uncharacterized membrane protein